MVDDPRLPQAGYNPTPRRSLADSLGFTQAPPPSQPGVGRAPVYPDEAPSPRPGDPPAPPASNTPLAHLDTGLLNRMARDMRSFIPSDPTFMAHVGVLLRSLISHELQNPDRIAADAAASQAALQQAADKLAADTAARHETEKAAIAGPDGSVNQADAAALEAKHQQELAAIAHQQAATDLAAKQAQDAKDFAALQQKQRDALVAEFTPPAQPV
jgi:hypothetical protein